MPALQHQQFFQKLLSYSQNGENNYIIFGANDYVCLRTLYETQKHDSSKPNLFIYDLQPVLAKQTRASNKFASLQNVASLLGIDVSLYMAHDPRDDATLLKRAASLVCAMNMEEYMDYKAALNYLCASNSMEESLEYYAMKKNKRTGPTQTQAAKKERPIDVPGKNNEDSIKIKVGPVEILLNDYKDLRGVQEWEENPERKEGDNLKQLEALTATIATLQTEIMDMRQLVTDLKTQLEETKNNEEEYYKEEKKGRGDRPIRRRSAVRCGRKKPKGPIKDLFIDEVFFHYLETQKEPVCLSLKHNSKNLCYPLSPEADLAALQKETGLGSKIKDFKFMEQRYKKSILADNDIVFLVHRSQYNHTTQKAFVSMIQQIIPEERFVIREI